MNITTEQAALKTAVSAEILGRLSRQAIDYLIELEANIETVSWRNEIGAPGIATAYDKVHVPLIAFRIYRAAFWENWEAVYFDPRFPTFHGARLKDTLALVSPKCRPAEAVVAVIERFAPDGYDPTWIAERLSAH